MTSLNFKHTPDQVSEIFLLGYLANAGSWSNISFQKENTISILALQLNGDVESLVY